MSAYEKLLDRMLLIRYTSEDAAKLIAEIELEAECNGPKLSTKALRKLDLVREFNKTIYESSDAALDVLTEGE